ncbi:SDR family NAD(P)-dependent oxidoreductase [Luteimicrobium subarcticum]|uniref:3alpha(Or 20beta)-hydroxysteroid dehydrogenase n=1 Tax=Luteimicrobium subarcticum TaxID=620910 RepID=A0A2M8WJP6_9MICO|nr:SDR family NAD(P)-dependent oxidoreductase [Luteimicrobium subarcticum]PJI91145.1 3alpha(or 20beta)-hydroxysteroid dehydrogenase [Luteimicrobium subarcticum]
MTLRNEAPGPPTGLPRKIVVVTGAARGQGAAEARSLAAAGAHVVALDVADTPAEALGDTTEYRRHDVTDRAAWASLATDMRNRFGRIDGLVNNAGITWRARLLDVDVADLERVHAVNLVGPVLAIQACAPLMPRGSSIVNVGSVAALTGHVPVAYTTSKWALRGLTRVACLELGPRGIRVNAVHPGYIETPMTASASPAFRDGNVTETPLGRTGTVDEVAALVTFLIGDGSSYVSGAEIPVDGGMTAHGGVKSIADGLAAASDDPSPIPSAVIDETDVPHQRHCLP